MQLPPIPAQPSIAIIGLGGAGAFIAAALGPMTMSSTPINLIFADGDQFEAKNQDRQFLANAMSVLPSDSEHLDPPYKAHIASLLLTQHRAYPVPEFYHPESHPWDYLGGWPQIVVLALDNNASRMALIKAMHDPNMPWAIESPPPYIVTVGNGDTYGQAHLMCPGDYDTPFDLRTALNMAADPGLNPALGETPEMRCTSGPALDLTPQTPTSNLASAAMGALLIQRLLALTDTTHLRPETLPFSIAFDGVIVKTTTRKQAFQ